MATTSDKQKPNFIFLAHWVEPWNWLLWWSKDLHSNPERAALWVWLMPIYVLMSIFYLVGRKAFDVVDRYGFKGMVGETVLVRNFAYHFLKASWREKIRQRILEAVLDAQARGVGVIGLGALTKAEWLTEGGKWIVDTLGQKLTVPIVHGDTLTAAAVAQFALRIIYDPLRKMEPYGPVFLTGATSKIGRAVALKLAQNGISVYLYTESRERFQKIKDEAIALGVGERIFRAKDLSIGRRCPLWITGKAEPGVGKKIIAALPQDAVVVNFSVPDPLSPKLLQSRPDVSHLDGGLMAYQTNQSSQFFMMRLRPGMIYACHAGTLVHAYKGWTHHEVGEVELSAMDECWLAAVELGLSLPRPTSFLLPLPAAPRSLPSRVVTPDAQLPLTLPSSQVVPPKAKETGSQSPTIHR